MRIGGLHINDEQLLVWGGVAALVVLFGPKLAQAIAQKTVSSAGGIITGTAAGVIEGAGQAVGVPLSDKTKCQQDLENGDTWNTIWDCTPADVVDFHSGQ